MNCWTAGALEGLPHRRSEHGRSSVMKNLQAPFSYLILHYSIPPILLIVKLLGKVCVSDLTLRARFSDLD
jgi:hypothetical protein